MTAGQSRSAPADGTDTRRISLLESLGAMTALALSSPLHCGWAVSALGLNFMPALRAGQCKIYFDEGEPRAFATWALVDEERDRDLRTLGRTPPPDLWSSGGNLWLIDVVAPFGGSRRVVRDLRRNHFADFAVAYAVRRNPDGSVKRISEWRQDPTRVAQAGTVR